MQVIADRTVEQQLDLTLGCEWRLQVPEYVHTYDELRQEVIVDNAPDMPVVVSESVPLLPRDLFSSELDTALKKTIEGLPEAPLVLFDARDLAFDSFGDAEVVAGLIADLFSDDFAPPMMPIQSAAALPAEPNAIDERAAEPSALAPESPILEPFITPSVGLQTHHLAITLVPYWLPELGVGAIQARTEWLDPETGQSQQNEAVIYQTSVMDHVVFLRDRLIFEDAMTDAHEAWMTQINTLNNALAYDPDQGLTALYRSWFETMALDGEAIEQGFLPGVPRQYLLDGIDAPRTHWERLPGVLWTDDPETTTAYGVTARVADEEAGTFVLQHMRRWRDENGIQQVDVVHEADGPKSLEVSVQTVWQTATRLARDFDDESRHDAQVTWREWFIADRDNEELNDDALDSADDADDRDDHDVGDEMRDDGWDVDMDE